MADKVNI